MNEMQLSILKNEVSVSGVIDTIRKLEEEQSLSTSKEAVFLKEYKTQCVVQTQNYVYKLYQGKTFKEGPFFSRIRNCLSKVYQDMGIDWSITSFVKGSSLFDFEQRQVLRVTSPEEVCFTEILLSMSDIYDEVEKMMELDDVLCQLKETGAFNDVKKLKIARACVNDYSDYGMFNKTPILFDDAEFYIAPVNARGEPCNIDPTFEASVKTSYGDFIFKNMVCETDYSTGKKTVADFMNNIFHAWILYVNDETESDLVARPSTDDLVKSGPTLQESLVCGETRRQSDVIFYGEH